MIKIVMILFIIIVYFWFFGFTDFYYIPSVHALGFFLVSFYFINNFNIEEYLSSLFMLLPLVLIYGIIGFLFYFFSIGNHIDWIKDTLIKVLFLPSSVLFIRAILSHITFNDIVNLNINEKTKIDLVVFRTIIERGTQSMRRLKWYLDNCQRHIGRSLLKNKVPKYCALILATYIALYDKAEILYQIIENRNSYMKRSI